jgi:hypothetical protein
VPVAHIERHDFGMLSSHEPPDSGSAADHHRVAPTP